MIHNIAFTEETKSLITTVNRSYDIFTFKHGEKSYIGLLSVSENEVSYFCSEAKKMNGMISIKNGMTLGNTSIEIEAILIE